MRGFNPTIHLEVRHKPTKLEEGAKVKKYSHPCDGAAAMTEVKCAAHRLGVKSDDYTNF